MPKAFLFTNKRYGLYNLNIPQPWRKFYIDGDDEENVDKTDTNRLQLEQVVNKNYFPAGISVSVPMCRDYCYEEDQPVNLTVKKLVSGSASDAACIGRSTETPVPELVDSLFNLRQLAEVSISIAPDSTSNNEGYGKMQSHPGKDLFSKRTPISLEMDIQEDQEDQQCIVESSTSINTAANLSQQHKCIECGKGYSTLSNLLRHRQTHRSHSDSNAIKTCPYCDKVYVSMPAFSMHLRTHNQGCKCPYCGKLFSRPWLLQGHIRTHTGEKPFECPSCNKKFADKSNLRAHTQTHSSEKPYICSRCNKRFGLKSYLSKHIESSCMKSSRASSSISSTTAIAMVTTVKAVSAGSLKKSGPRESSSMELNSSGSTSSSSSSSSSPTSNL